MDEFEFEALLREFRPRRPAPLPPARKARPMVWLVGAVAAAAVAVAVTAVVQDFRPARNSVAGRNISSAGNVIVGQSLSPVRNSVPTVGSLTPLALSDPAAFDAALTRMSRTLLPDVEQPNRALSALGRDSR